MFRIGVFFLLFCLLSCGASQSPASEEEIGVLKELIESGRYEFRAEWAMPQSGNDMNAIASAGLLRVGDSPNRINLLGNPNFLRLEGEKASAYLPFYGEQQLNPQMNSTDQAIRFDNEVQNLRSKFNRNKNQYEIQFDISGQNNSYRIFMAVFPSMTANLRVNSANRSFISYQGKVTPVKEKQGE